MKFIRNLYSIIAIILFSKFTSLRIKNEFNTTCNEIKNLGEQMKFCRKSSSKEEDIIDCLKNFCSICCGDNKNCQNSCEKSHSLFESHDPEEKLISVCQTNNLSDYFEKICLDDSKEEKQECVVNICYDCCKRQLNNIKSLLFNKCISNCNQIKENAYKINVPGNKIVNQTDLRFKETNNDDNENNFIDEHSEDPLPLQNEKANLNTNSTSKLKDSDISVDIYSLICENLFMKNNFKHFGKSINSFCNTNYTTINTENKNTCLDNLCIKCCNILEIGILELIFLETEVKLCNKECKAEELSNNLPDKQEYNINDNYYNLITSLCKAKYFRGNEIFKNLTFRLSRDTMQRIL